ncbi:MAG: AAA family ATPase [Myxococcales bacterium]|nr:AAA family ATPase [Myxococcales bacterium]
MPSSDFAALAARAESLRGRLDRFRRALGRFFVERQDAVDLMVVCAVAQEPLLLVGAPGTAKSALVTRFRDALGLSADDYFEYMLTRFTEPSEVFGPVDIEQLREGRYVRRSEGKLPTARLVFLDEVFKASSAILNALLTVINERKFYQDGQPVPVPLAVLFAATNDVPAHAELDALKDRFALRVLCPSVHASRLHELLDAGLDGYADEQAGRRPWAEGLATLDDVLDAHRYLTTLMGQREVGPDGETVRDRDRYFPAPVLDELRRLLATLAREEGLQISDRKVVKLYRLLRTRAWLLRGGTVERDDLRLLAHLGDSREQLERLAERVPQLLGLDG